MVFTNFKAQGTVEYLVIIAVVVVISLVVVGLFTGMFSNSSQQIRDSSSKLGSGTSGGISIVEAVLDFNGDSLVLVGNNSSDVITLTRISAGGVENDFSEQIVGMNSITFSLSDLLSGCRCLSGQKSVSCEYVVNYTQNGLEKTDRVTKTIDCVVDSVPVNPTSVVGLGSGTLADPWIINSCLELQDMNNNLDGNYALSVDLNCYNTITWNNGAGFRSIGPNSTAKFTGSFDGRNKKIYSLYMYQPAVNYIGLFGYSSGTISNIGLIDSNIYGKNYVGTLAGISKGPIFNSYSTGTVIGSSWIGGLIGYSSGGTYNGSISNSYSSGFVIGGSTAGGLVGYSTGYISNSYSDADVFGTFNIGGLAGSSGGVVINTYSTGDASGTNTVGGLLGGFYGSVMNSFATGSVSDVISSGGAIGYCGSTGGTYSNIWWFNSKSNCRYVGLNDFCTSNSTCTKASSANDFFDTTQDVYDLNIPYWTFGSDANWIARDNNYPILSWQ